MLHSKTQFQTNKCFPKNEQFEFSTTLFGINSKIWYIYPKPGQVYRTGECLFQFQSPGSSRKSQLVTDDSKHSKKSKLDLGPFLMDWSTVFSDKSWISFEILFNPMESLFYPSDSSILIHRISKNFSTFCEFQFGYDNQG